MGKGPFQTNPGRHPKGIVATLEKMNKYQRAGHILEKLRNDTEQSKNFMDEIKNAQKLTSPNINTNESPRQED